MSVSGRVKSVDSCRCRRRCSVPCEDGKLKIIDGPMRSISDYSAENRIFNEAALRVVRKLPHWTPAVHNNKKAVNYFTLRVTMDEGQMSAGLLSTNEKSSVYAAQ